MSKKVLAIVASPRRRGNSELLTEQFIKGAAEAGHEVETVFLRKQKIAPCLACEACLRNGGTCVQKDDMSALLEKIIAADVLVLATPVYYYSVSGQMKVMIDRTLAGGGKMLNKECYFIATAADGKEAMETTMHDLEGFVRCLPGSVVKGKIYGAAFGIGEIQGDPSMAEAYEMGKTV